MRCLVVMLALVAAFVPSWALASIPGLQVNPLKYQSTLLGSQVREGYVDVANPSDTTLTIQASVQAFRQYDLAGNLNFYNDATVASAIKLGLTSFQLAPQEAVRVTFTVDPSKLPQGGTYAVLFFRTIPPPETAGTSFVTESANVGTLLLLQNGPEAAHIGKITSLNLPFLQLGSGISGTANYQNTNHSLAPVAFSPSLTERIVPWSAGRHLTGPYVLPGSTRKLQITSPGSYFGFFPVQLQDNASGNVATVWVFACTGVYAFSLIVLLSFLIVWVASRVLRNLPIFPGRRPRAGTSSHRSLDGLAPKA